MSADNDLYPKIRADLETAFRRQQDIDAQPTPDISAAVAEELNQPGSNPETSLASLQETIDSLQAKIANETSPDILEKLLLQRSIQINQWFDLRSADAAVEIADNNSRTLVVFDHDPQAGDLYHTVNRLFTDEKIGESTRALDNAPSAAKEAVQNAMTPQVLGSVKQFILEDDEPPIIANWLDDCPISARDANLIMMALDSVIMRKALDTYRAGRHDDAGYYIDITSSPSGPQTHQYLRQYLAPTVFDELRSKKHMGPAWQTWVKQCVDRDCTSEDAQVILRALNI